MNLKPSGVSDAELRAGVSDAELRGGGGGGCVAHFGVLNTGGASG